MSGFVGNYVWYVRAFIHPCPMEAVAIVAYGLKMIGKVQLIAGLFQLFDWACSMRLLLAQT
jgi:hypothetical protein